MLKPELDIENRKPVWDALQMFWMDVDPEDFINEAVSACTQSVYSLSEIERIYWNEVYPAVKFNLLFLSAPEWTGFELNWLIERILKKHRFGKRLPLRFFRPYANGWWQKLEAGIIQARKSYAHTKGSRRSVTTSQK